MQGRASSLIAVFGLLALSQLTACTGQAGQTDQAGQSGDGLNVITWNIEWFPGGHSKAGQSAKKAQMAEAQAVLQQLKPDIFLFQEVRNEKAARQLCSAVPGLQVSVVSRFPQRDPSWPEQNVGIASKLEPLAAYFREWKKGDPTPPRGFAFAAFELPERILLVYSVHLKSNGGDRSGRRRSNIAKREESKRQLLAHINDTRAQYEKQQDKPVGVIIGGDWNTSLEDGRFKKEQTIRGLRAEGFHWAYQGVPEHKRWSLPSRPGSKHPPATFDHFLVWGLGQPQARVVKVPGAVSDHLPVRMLVREPKN